MAACHGSLIAFLDCDDLWEPRKLALQVPAFEDPNVGICISNTRFFDETSSQVLYSGAGPATGYVFPLLIRRNFISLETVILRKEALAGLDQVFDPTYNMIEEYDLFLRVAEKWHLAYVDEVLAGWRVHGNSITHSQPNLLIEEIRIMFAKFVERQPEFGVIYRRQVMSQFNRCILIELLNVGSNETRSECFEKIWQNTGSLHLKLICSCLALFPRLFRILNAFRNRTKVYL